MKVSSNSKNFDPCPEFVGRAVCVDITPLEKTPSKFGERETFRFVFEVDMKREDGTPYCVWSAPMTPTLNEKANLRKFVKGWLGRDLSGDELNDFETETLLGKPGFIVVTQTQSDNQVYANITSMTPHRESAGEPLKPSGTFKRKQDKTSGGSNTGSGSTSGGGADYRHAQQPAEQMPEWQKTKVHVGKFAGQQLRDLPPEAVQALKDKWVPEVLAKGSMTADDNRLKKALDEHHKAHNPPAEKKDDVPY